MYTSLYIQMHGKGMKTTHTKEVAEAVWVAGARRVSKIFSLLFSEVAIMKYIA